MNLRLFIDSNFSKKSNYYNKHRGYSSYELFFLKCRRPASVKQGINDEKLLQIEWQQLLNPLNYSTSQNQNKTREIMVGKP